MLFRSYVKKMHTDSGLINEIANGVSMIEAENQIMAYLNRYAPEAGKSPLAGNSVGVDRLFINRDWNGRHFVISNTADASSNADLAQ